jgi:hypothetical protein
MNTRQSELRVVNAGAQKQGVPKLVNLGPPWFLTVYGTWSRLDGRHRGRTRTFAPWRLSLLDRVLHRLSFGELVEAVIGDDRVVEKHILSAIGLNEPKSFILDELFDLSRRHNASTPVKQNSETYPAVEDSKRNFAANKREIIIAKHRQTPIGGVIAAWALIPGRISHARIREMAGHGGR